MLVLVRRAGVFGAGEGKIKQTLPRSGIGLSAHRIRWRALGTIPPHICQPIDRSRQQSLQRLQSLRSPHAQRADRKVWQ